MGWYQHCKAVPPYVVALACLGLFLGSLSLLNQEGLAQSTYEVMPPEGRQGETLSLTLRVLLNEKAISVNPKPDDQACYQNLFTPLVTWTIQEVQFTTFNGQLDLGDGINVSSVVPVRLTKGPTASSPLWLTLSATIEIERFAPVGDRDVVLRMLDSQFIVRLRSRTLPPQDCIFAATLDVDFLICAGCFEVLPALPDLIISNVRIRPAGESNPWEAGDPRLHPSLWEPGQTVQVEALVDIINAGGPVDQAFSVNLSVDGQERNAVSVERLDAFGEITDLLFSWTVTEGLHQFRFRVDTAGEIEEGNEVNNTMNVDTIPAYRIQPERLLVFGGAREMLTAATVPNLPPVSLSPILAGPANFPASETVVVSLGQMINFRMGSVGVEPKDKPARQGQAYYPFAFTRKWTFGDGAAGSGEEVSHAYADGRFSGRARIEFGRESLETPFELESTDKPVVTEVMPTYYHTFIVGPEVENVYTARVNWNGNAPTKVKFELRNISTGLTLPGKEIDVGDPSSETFEFTINVGSLLPVNNVLKVTAVGSKSGSTKESNPLAYNIRVLPVPSWLLDHLGDLKVKREPPAVTYDFLSNCLS